MADSSFAVIELLKQVSETPDVSLITRLRPDVALYDPAPPRAPRQNGRPRKKESDLHCDGKGHSTRASEPKH